MFSKKKALFRKLLSNSEDITFLDSSDHLLAPTGNLCITIVPLPLPGTITMCHYHYQVPLPCAITITRYHYHVLLPLCHYHYHYNCAIMYPQLFELSLKLFKPGTTCTPHASHTTNKRMKIPDKSVRGYSSSWIYAAHNSTIYRSVATSLDILVGIKVFSTNAPKFAQSLLLSIKASVRSPWTEKLWKIVTWCWLVHSCLDICLWVLTYV